MLSISTILTVIFVHWFADFVLQTDWQAKNKSKNNKALIAHTGIYSFVWFLTCLLLGFSALNCIIFTAITFVAHTLTDYFTSRLNSKLWAQGKVHNFFVSVGFDQVLHYVQLFLTLLLII